MQQRISVREPMEVAALLELRDYVKRHLPRLGGAVDAWMQHGSLQQNSEDVDLLQRETAAFLGETLAA